MTLKRCKEQKLSGVLTLIVIASISLATLSPAVSADPVTDGTFTTNALVTPGEIDIGDTTRVTLTVNAVNATEKVPVDVVLVTDLSGSMQSNNKLSGAKKALKTFVGLGDDEMYIGLASFSNANKKYSSETWQKWLDQINNGASPFHPYAGYNDTSRTTPKNYHNSAFDSNGYSDAHIDRSFTQDKTSLNNKINSYNAEGGTNIAGGINAAKKMLEEQGTPGHLQVIIVMSDGIATMAPIEPDSLKAYMPSDWISDESTTARNATEMAADVVKQDGFIVYAIGFGSDADEDTLRAIASSEDKYYFAPTNAQLAEVYSGISGEIEVLATGHVYYVLPDDVEYAGNATTDPDSIIGNTLWWDVTLTPSNPWTVSFDVYPTRMGRDTPVNVVPDSKVTYGADETDGGIVRIEGEININPNNSPHNEFSLTLADGTEITRDDLTQDYGGCSGEAAIHVHVKPKGNGNQNSLIRDGEPYPLVNANTYDIYNESGEQMNVTLYNDHINPQGKAMGHWWIAINATNATINEASKDVSFPALYVDVNGMSCKDFGLTTTGEETVIGQTVSIDGYVVVDNTGNEADVTVKICVDYPHKGNTVHTSINTVNADAIKNISVSTPWIPMSSGKHFVSIHVYKLKEDGTEFWAEALGPNTNTTSKTIYIKKVKK